jgi:nicotinamide riboside transporter PnuC
MIQFGILSTSAKTLKTERYAKIYLEIYSAINWQLYFCAILNLTLVILVMIQNLSNYPWQTDLAHNLEFYTQIICLDHYQMKYESVKKRFFK